MPCRAGRRGALRRRFKALAGVRHHVGAAECPAEPGDVVPRDEDSRLWRGVRHHVGITVDLSVAGDVVPRDEESSLWRWGGTTSNSYG